MKKILLFCLFILNIPLLLSMSGQPLAWETKEQPEYVPLRGFKVRSPNEWLDWAIVVGSIGTVYQALREGADANNIKTLILAIDQAQHGLDILENYVDEREIIRGYDRLKILELILENNNHINTIYDNLFQFNIHIYDKMFPLEHLIDNLKNQNYNPPKLQVLKILIAYGANIYAKTKSGDTILDVAKRSKWVGIKKVMEDYDNLLKRLKAGTNRKQILRDAIKDDYHLIVERLIMQGVSVDEDDLQLAKDNNSRRSGRIIINQLRLSCPIGGISRTGLGLPQEIAQNIARFIQY